MHKYLYNLKDFFINDILKQGKVIYESPLKENYEEDIGGHISLYLKIIEVV